MLRQQLPRRTCDKVRRDMRHATERTRCRRVLLFPGGQEETPRRAQAIVGGFWRAIWRPGASYKPMLYPSVVHNVPALQAILDVCCVHVAVVLSVKKVRCEANEA